MTFYRPRELSPLLIKALENMPVVVVTGMRQAGKSTMLLNHPGLKDRRYISLDDFAQLEAARKNPESLLGKGEAVTIDEAQRCPELLMAVKRAVDLERIPGRFLLSGSANFSLLKGVSESLAGRAVYLQLHPFTRREISGIVSSKPFLSEFFQNLDIPDAWEKYRSVEEKEILLGGMPSICLAEAIEPRFWFKGYEQTYLERDIRALSQVADLISFRLLLQLASLRTGQILKLSELARDAKLNSVTAARYMGLLETSFVINKLLPFIANRSSRLIKSPKIYLSDSGLASYLNGSEDFSPVPGTPIKGALLETYIAQNLAAIIEACWPQARLYFWGIQGRHEVDFIIVSGRESMAVEVKAGSRWENKDLSGLRAFLKTSPDCRAAVLAYNGASPVKLDDRLWAIPLGLLLS